MISVEIKFAHGITEMLFLDAEQYKEFLAFLDESDGFFEAGGVLVNREFICVVKMNVQEKGLV